MGSIKKAMAVGLFMTVALFCRWEAALAYESKECIACHNLESTQSKLKIDTQTMAGSVHGDNADCTDCHSQVEDESHTQTPGSGAVDCGQCHDQPNLHGMSSIEGNRPQCTTCHTKHAILAKDDPASTVHADRLEQTCGQCHPAQSGRVDYLSWLPSFKIETHPKADLSGDYSAANCIGCHQGRAAHGETELISQATCHRCHMTAEGRSALLGFIHPQADPARQPGVFAVALIYQLVLVLLLAGGIVFFVRKFSGTQRP